MVQQTKKVLKNVVEIGDKFTFKMRTGDERQDVIGTVVKKMSSKEARATGLTRSKRGGTFMLLDVPGLPEVVARFRGQVKPYKKER